MQAPATVFSCDECLNPLILCRLHPLEPIADYGEPEVIVRINPDTGGGEPSTTETFGQVVESEKQVAASSSSRKTDSDRFPCTLCSQKFTSNHNLQNHSNSHDQRKNRHCVPKGCESSFTTISSLKRHR
ncbi:hypothetical protein K443DRAFT_597846 [Laccaria amethystina LaAM-08-1]|uniref:C2H2-type domain-containing protein n=1 Tax=Laccaria amethystina LaAM-08-1 TaxID=1095629 RepID=A0A0C9X6M5_9AGAR|nr:hypothetical protein K443DRAFT_597846 [Laccaria amethystina LaAM-08-1]